MARNAKSNKNSSTSNDSNANNANFNENDRKPLYEINNTVKLLVEEVKFLKNEIERTNRKAKRLEIENERLKKSVNLSLFKIDALEQCFPTYAPRHTSAPQDGIRCAAKKILKLNSIK